MPVAEHVSRRASAAAAAAASQIVPINSKRERKRPVQERKPSPATPLAPMGGAPDLAPTLNDALPDFEGPAESRRGIRTKASKPPDAPPGALPRDENGQLSLLQSRAGIDADESFGSQEYALSSYLKLHPVLSLESTSYHTLQLVANLVESTSIPTREIEVVSKPHDDGVPQVRTAPLEPAAPEAAPLAAYPRAQAAQHVHRRAAVLLRRPVHLRVDGALALRRSHGHGVHRHRVPAAQRGRRSSGSRASCRTQTASASCAAGT